MVQTSDGPWFASGSPDVFFHAIYQSVTYGKAGRFLAWSDCAVGGWGVTVQWGMGSAVGHDVPRALHGMRSVMTCGVPCAACVIPTWSVAVSCHAAQAIMYEPIRRQSKVHSDVDLLYGKIHSELASKGW